MEENPMTKESKTAGILFVLILALTFITAGCGKPEPILTVEPTASPAPTKDLPRIKAAAPDRTELPRYESLDIAVALDAKYSNPYDIRQVSLDGIFTGPDGKSMKVPGFWDGEAAWHVRFTPSMEGEWTYELTVTDSRGTSLPLEGKLKVTSSDLHGWLQAGNWVNPSYSGHYLVYQDGTPFYGLGHCDPNVLIQSFSAENGVGLFNQMKQAGENYVMWWPIYNNSPITSSYNDYLVGPMKVIDLVVADAQKKGIFLIFTIWDHNELRDGTHPGNWGNYFWSKNGFNQLGDLQSFFTSPEMWAWQENFYRYIIARWGYSPAIGMWQTVSEINGTNAYDQRDPWHTKVNNFFVENDPYRHPTTASQSGGGNDIAWPEGHQVMDAPQVHIYDPLNNNPVGAASVLAQWTSTMWNEADKPNWVGEFGVPGNDLYPELYHNSIWAALAAGASMTPAEWNGGGAWGEMTADMLANLSRLGQFVQELPLAKLNPSPLEITSSDPKVRGWGVAGMDGGLFWVQDYSMEGKSIDAIRAGQVLRKGVQVEIQGLTGGIYTITPYDTWNGSWLTALQVNCSEGTACEIALPDFKADMAFKIGR
jgi:Domain of unknown function (DUF5060)